jgi:O-acetylhomoserine/O-acetylserine sulfhydrylase-like pyridoxal-dependent enzyme
VKEELEKIEKDLGEAKKIANWLSNSNKVVKQNYNKVKFYLKDDKKNFFQLSKNPRSYTT